MNDLGTERIETERLILRKFNERDAQGLFSWASNPNVTRFVSWKPYRSLQEAEESLEKWIKEYEKGSYHWCVQLKNTDVIIGRISVVVHWRNHYCEVGYCYGEQYWNAGYGTEALKSVLKFLLLQCDFHTIEAKTSSENVASERIMRKAGMMKEAVLKERCYIPEENRYDDLLCYYINKNILVNGNEDNLCENSIEL